MAVDHRRRTGPDLEDQPYDARGACGGWQTYTGIHIQAEFIPDWAVRLDRRVDDTRPAASLGRSRQMSQGRAPVPAWRSSRYVNCAKPRGIPLTIGLPLVC